MAALYTRLGFRVTGTIFSDQWGGIVRMTAHLQPTKLRHFIERFGSETAPSAQNQGGAS
jgi:hypothetical protein